MKKNLSPWIHQLDTTRTHRLLDADLDTDIAIIGAGIAGISTAFFALKHTNMRVVMLEKFKLAHGATGHNAGQIVSYFERGFASLVEEFGLKMATYGEKSVEDAWELLDEMYADAGLDIPLSRFIGHAGLINYEQVLWHLKSNLLRTQAGLPVRQLIVANDAPFAQKIPDEFDGLYTYVPREEVFTLLETKDMRFHAVLASANGCMNSALFCQEILKYLEKQYPDRFTLYEHTPVPKVILHEDYALLDADTHTVRAQRVVLCTNGFENIHLVHNNGLQVDTKYHHLLNGKIGYMSGYLETLTKPPTALRYHMDPIPSIESAYYYLTRRPYEYEKGSLHNLISVGGPELDISEDTLYSHEDEYPDEKMEEIDAFIRAEYEADSNKKIEYIFTWHGLMGYTRNRVRLVGPDPKSSVLLYNLGCNGVGILPSLYGGKKIARHLRGDTVEPSIFDVPEK